MIVISRVLAVKYFRCQAITRSCNGVSPPSRRRWLGRTAQRRNCLLRGTSSVSTGGVDNFLLSTAENACAGTVPILAILFSL